MKSWFTKTVKWIKNHFTRKFTVPFHICGGAICAGLIVIYPPLGITLFASFGLFEFWQGIAEEDCGHLDFWDFMFGAFIVGTILVIKFLI